jgi:uncharacterized phage protein (TIGR01671 family)
MRPIKFRIWDKLANQLVYLDKILLVNYTFNGSPNGFELSFDGFGKRGCANKWLRKPEDYIIQQFTGLKDKNGIEVYEGDIIKYIRFKWKLPNHPKNNKNLINIFEIYYDNKEYMFKRKGKICSGNLRFEDSRAKKCEIKIIGNIFENKELLEKYE